jgi:pyruvate dehydrogenase E1 component
VPVGAEVDVVRGCYKFASYLRSSDVGQSPKTSQSATLLGSGAILTEVLKAAQMLAEQGIDVDVYSVTSWSELARDGRACLQRTLAGDSAAATPFLSQKPQGRLFVTLGTDGFGRSDTRDALRKYFGVDSSTIFETAMRLVNNQ